MPKPNPPYLKIFRDVTSKGMPFKWEVVDDPERERAYVIVAGDIAQRMIELLTSYSITRPSSPDDIDPRDMSPNCHSSALYAAGLVEKPWRLKPEDFPKLYAGLEELITPVQPKLPAVAHLLTKYSSIKRLNDDICVHTVLAVASIEDGIICFQKHNYGPANFSSLESAERKYKTSKILWADIC